MGFKLAGNPQMQEGRFEPEETQIVTHILPHVDVVVNVGANIGYYCAIALSKGKTVIAFEPMPLNLQYLYQNMRANNWEDRVEIYPMALSNRVGVIDLYGGGTGASLVKGWAGAPTQYSTPAPTSTLDNVLGSRFQGRNCFILVDIEGAEHLMLKGAATILQMQPRPIWLMEISIAEHQPEGVSQNPNLLSTFRTFWDAGYDAYTADKQLQPVLPDEIEQIAKTGVDTLHTHNFLFVESGKKWNTRIGHP